MVGENLYKTRVGVSDLGGEIVKKDLWLYGLQQNILEVLEGDLSTNVMSFLLLKNILK